MNIFLVVQYSMREGVYEEVLSEEEKRERNGEILYKQTPSEYPPPMTELAHTQCNSLWLR